MRFLSKIFKKSSNAQFKGETLYLAYETLHLNSDCLNLLLNFYETQIDHKIELLRLLLVGTSLGDARLAEVGF